VTSRLEQWIGPIFPGKQLLRLGREVDQPLAIGEHLCPLAKWCMRHLAVDQLLAQKELLAMSRAIGSFVWSEEEEPLAQRERLEVAPLLPHHRPVLEA